MKFIKTKGVWNAQIIMKNGLVASVIERPVDYLVNINHPLTKQRRFENVEDVEKYIEGMEVLGEVQ